MGTPEEPIPFGTLLRELRASMGLTQADLADRAGLSARGISDLERGARRAPHPHTVRQLAAALHLSDEQCGVLLAAARRGDTSRVDDSSPSLPPAAGRAHVLGVLTRLATSGRAASAVAVAALLAVVALGTVLVPRSPSQVAPTAVPTRAPIPGDAGQPIVSDTLSDPSNGVFPRENTGTTLVSFSNGGSAPYEWDSAYMYSAIVAHVLGPYPANPDSAWLAAGTSLDQPVPHDFAVQVRGRVTRSPQASAFGLEFQAGPNQLAEFDVTPADQGYRLELAPGQSPSMSGRSAWILPPSQPNLVRLELRGDALRVLVNGHELARAAPPELATRQGGTISLRWAMTGPPLEGGSVEVRFAQFALYALP